MADALIRRRILAGLLGLAGTSLAVAADSLRDPMRPPATSATPAGPGSPGMPAAAAATGGGPAAPADEVADAIPRLQSIRRPAAGGAPRALFGDSWVAVGGKVGDWRVRAIDDDAVTLQSTRESRETQRVPLHQLEIRRTPGSP